MDTIRICPQCRKPLPPEAPQGLCPACLVKVAMPSEATTVVDPASTDAPRPTPSAASVPAQPPTPAALAPHFPQLEILELIGAGGMGMVYKARQPQLDRFVALKILLPEIAAKDAAFAERFLREARALARLSHPNIVAVFDFGQAGGFYYFIMEFVDGANLRQLLANHEITPREALSIVPKVCDALQFAHDEGVMHRDIKPENILIDRKGRVKIADFGLAKLFGAEHAAHSTLTHTGVVMGTPRYMAPEQIEKPQTVDHRADIYSLGVVFYEMLTGELPLGRFEPPSHKVGVDVRLDEVVLRSLEKKPERRYQRASEVKTDVESIAGSVPAASDRGEIPKPARAGADADKVVRGPAVGLIAAGALNWVGGIVVFAGLSYYADRDSGFKGAIGGVAIGVMALSAIIFIGAFRMMRLQSWGLANASSVIAMLATPGNLIGLPAGIWSLMTLARREVKDAFRQRAAEHARPAAVPAPRFSRKAIAGAVWAAMAVLALPSWMVTRPVLDAHAPLPQRIEIASLAPMQVVQPLLAQAAPPRPSRVESSWGEKSQPGFLFVLGMIFLAVGFTAPIGTTVLGLLALHDIRHSQGMITGLPLALGDALIFPLVALNGLLYWLCHLANRVAIEIAPGSGLFRKEELVLPAAIVLWLVIDTLLVWLAWRAAKKRVAA